MEVSEIIQRGLDAKLITIDADQKSVSCRAQNKKYRLSDPEEIVRAGAYVSLILDYGYPAKQLDIEFPVPHRVPSLTADIVVFKDKARKTPYIVVECKREEASKGELDQAVEQGFGYPGRSTMIVRKCAERAAILRPKFPQPKAPGAPPWIMSRTGPSPASW